MAMAGVYSRIKAFGPCPLRLVFTIHFRVNGEGLIRMNNE